MNPFDLSGPQFLLFYLVVGIAVIVGAYLLLRWFEGGDATARLPKEPHAIAYLRGGPREVLRVATLSLIDRGLLVVEGDRIRRCSDQAQQLVKHPIEKEVLDCCTGPRPFSVIASTQNRDRVRSEYQAMLREAGLIPGPDQIAVRVAVLLLGGAALWSIAGYKLALAFARGRSNLGFLYILATLTTIVLCRVVMRSRTAKASRTIAALQEMFTGLRRRATALPRGAAPAEVLQLAATFGVAAVPLSLFPHRKALGPEQDANDRDGRSWWSSGSGCGSSCGSSGCGSSCGGGGGCGGCGS